MSEKVKHPVLWATLFTIISLAWVFPIVLVVINSFKQKAYISRNAFSIPTGKAFVGLQNYTRGIKRTNLIESFGWTVVVTVGAVLLILLCTSMCAWWIVRVNNRTAKSLYLLFLFNMIIHAGDPFGSSGFLFTILHLQPRFPALYYAPKVQGMISVFLL